MEDLYVNRMAGPALGGAGPNWEQFRSAQVPSQLKPRSVELRARPNWLKAGPAGGSKKIGLLYVNRRVLENRAFIRKPEGLGKSGFYT